MDVTGNRTIKDSVHHQRELPEAVEGILKMEVDSYVNIDIKSV